MVCGAGKVSVEPFVSPPLMMTSRKKTDGKNLLKPAAPLPSKIDLVTIKTKDVYLKFVP